MQGRSTGRRSGEQGYVLLTLLLFVAVLVIMAAAVVPEITFQIRRDREEELIHRGVQYSRAIRRYVKKFGRYPTRVEELENTNRLRFLRKKYKDPITGKDFKLLHVGEVQLMPGTGIAGATPVGQMPGALLGQPLGQQPQQNQLGQGTAAGTQQTDQEKSDNPDNKDNKSDSSSSSDKLSGQVFGGGPIVGVASTSKDVTIREFNHKNHYNQWQFIYDPASDRGGLLNTPAQPPLQGAVPQQQGVPGTGIQQQPQQPVQPQPAPPAQTPEQQ
jgi:type II secretory pathway pseudopilin PulG